MSDLSPVTVPRINDPIIRSVFEDFKEIINFLVEHRVNDVISSTISTGAGTIKMSSANPATNTKWIPVYYENTTYWVPGFTTNSP